MSTVVLSPSPSFQTPAPATQLRRALSADVLRLKRTPALWLTLASGAFPVALTFLIFYFKGEYLLKPGQDPWPTYLMQSWQTACALLLPLFVVLLTGLVLNVENKAVAWKHVYAQPVGRGAVFGSKLLVLMGLNALAMLAYTVILLGSGLLLGLLRPSLHFQDHAVPLLATVTLLWHTYIATLGILAIQYVASLWWRSFATPVALGMGATIAALTLMRWEHIDWVPYATPLLALQKAASVPKGHALDLALAKAEWLTLGWFGLVLLGGYVLLRYRHEG
ncbi:hypothetical protein F0P96_15610 [Hymenobacter busanensis]|uniref:Uncharacterized protein n=1 Tax=Hymenobacter busanensis TaxID=2607656 RepID=A0A7L5A429_9BACT|nr:ABC transporter permease [Hymenobacter busanensis]KAA9331658.1 hypothetical protein F0P96_15610 [Hymenobacter busanensis]QHJ08810.1 ABC transporter permease subunit [Hymenobacter busanensis]